MSLVVQKFGGTSVGSIERIQRVAERVCATRAAGHDVVVVVSAMAGETNRLVKLAYAISENPIGREYDVLVSSGEQVSIALVALAIPVTGVPLARVPSEDLTPSLCWAPLVSSPEPPAKASLRTSVLGEPPIVGFPYCCPTSPSSLCSSI